MVEFLHYLINMNENKNLSRSQLNYLSGNILGAAFKVHSQLGPGLLESVYEVCLKHEMNKKGIRNESQVALPAYYDQMEINIGYRVDFLVENSILVELKSVEIINSLHEAQLLTYLKLSGLKLGLLINFNVLSLKEGITRLVNQF